MERERAENEAPDTAAVAVAPLQVRAAEGGVPGIAAVAALLLQVGLVGVVTCGLVSGPEAAPPHMSWSPLVSRLPGRPLLQCPLLLEPAAVAEGRAGQPCGDTEAVGVLVDIEAAEAWAGTEAAGA